MSLAIQGLIICLISLSVYLNSQSQELAELERIHQVQISVTPNRQLEYLKKHLDLDPRYMQAILDGEIVLGMLHEMVIASWGHPQTVLRTQTTWGQYEDWAYGGDPQNLIYLQFKDGELISWD